MQCTRCRRPSVHGQVGSVSAWISHAPCAVAPQLVALRRPVVAEQLQHAGRAVQLDRGRAVLLHREAGRDDGQPALAEVDQHVRVVLGLDLHLLAGDVALRDRDAGHRGHAPRRAEDAAQRDDVVDAEVEQRTAAPAVEPGRPVGARPAVAGAGRDDRADVAGRDPSRGSRGRWATAGCAAPAAGGRGSSRPARPVRPPRSSDVAIGFSTSTCLPACERRAGERPVLVHRRQHQHQVDVRVADHVVRAASATGRGRAGCRPRGACRRCGRRPPRRAPRRRHRGARAATCTGPRTRSRARARRRRHSLCGAPSGSTRPPSEGWSASCPPVMASAAAKAVMAGRAVMGASRRSASSPPGSRTTVAPRAEQSALGLVQQRIVAGREAQHEMALAEREHGGGGALARLAALGRHHRDLLEEQRALQRRRPGRARAEHDRRARHRVRRVLLHEPLGRRDRPLDRRRRVRPARP